ncbi:MAG: hypothetical protein AB8B80_03005 [Marinicellaceae bacterium]
MKYLLLLIMTNSVFAVPPDANINDVVMNELLFNPHNITPATGQDCNGDKMARVMAIMQMMSLLSFTIMEQTQ